MFFIILKLKKIYKHAVRKFPYLLRYVSDQCKIQQMCHKAILENGGTLKAVSDCCKNQVMCNKAVDNYPSALEFVPEYCKTQEMCNKAVNRFFLYLILFLIKKFKKCLSEVFLKINF